MKPMGCDYRIPGASYELHLLTGDTTRYLDHDEEKECTFSKSVSDSSEIKVLH